MAGARPTDPSVRIGDHDREAVSSELRGHFTSGHLDVEEFSARLDETWRATTAGELSHALRDLPRSVPAADPSGRLRSDGRHRGPGVMRRISDAHTRTFAMVMGLLVVIWAVSGFGDFWPIWPMLFWGFFVFRHHRLARRWDRAVPALTGQGRGLR